MNSKKFILIALALTVLIPAIAQVVEPEAALRSKDTKATEDGWRHGGVSTLSFSQAYLSNWAAGGENSYSLNGLVSAFSSYRKNSFTWDNTLDMGYGFMNQQTIGYRKTDDRFNFTSRAGYRAFSDFFYSGLVNFRTQFDNGYNFVADPKGETPISKFMAPAYLIAALGLNYQPNSNFSAFLAPLTGRLTIVNDSTLANAGAFGVEPGHKTRTEFGGYIRTVYSKNDFEAEWLRNVTFSTQLDLFSNYLDKPQNITVNWGTLIALRVNRLLSVNVSTNLIYDPNVLIADKDGNKATRVQFQQLLGVGFSYNF
jgi:hypothetical protein